MKLFRNWLILSIVVFIACATELHAKKVAENSKYAFAHLMEKVVAGIVLVVILVFVIRRLNK
jgi:hypothetical protein